MLISDRWTFDEPRNRTLLCLALAFFNVAGRSVWTTMQMIVAAHSVTQGTTAVISRFQLTTSVAVGTERTVGTRNLFRIGKLLFASSVFLLTFVVLRATVNVITATNGVFYWTAGVLTR